MGPGLLSTGLITLAGVMNVAKVLRTGPHVPLRGMVGLGLFTVGGVLITWLLEALHSARRRAEESAALAQRRQETLRQSEARFQAILENSPSVVYMKDTVGRYLMINRRFATLFAIEEADVVGKTDFDLFPPATAEQFSANDRLVIKTGAPIEFEELVPHQDRVHTYLSVKFPLFAADGSISAICGKSTDITDRKRSEEHRLRLARQSALRADVSMALALNERALATILEHCTGPRSATSTWRWRESGRSMRQERPSSSRPARETAPISTSRGGELLWEAR